MEVDDFYTGEKKEIIIPEGCIMIDEEKLSYGNYALIDDDEDIDGLNAKIVVDFFPNKPKRLSDIPLYKSSKEGQFKVIVIKDKYYKWVDLNRRQKQNEIKREQNIAKQQAIYDRISHLRLEGDIFRQNSQFESAITSYSLSLQVDYKTVNSSFKQGCIGQNLLSHNGLIAIYHKQNDFEKEKEHLEKAILLSSSSARFKEDYIKFQYRLDKLLGTYIQKEIPPESHMNVVYNDLTNYMEILDKMYHPIVIKNGCVVIDKKEEKIRLKIRKYFDELMAKGKHADSNFDYKTAVDMYERLVAERYDDSFPYDRLMQLYYNYKLYEDEVRIIELAIKTFQPLNEEFWNGYKNTGFHYFDKRLERWEKRLVSAQKRLQSLKKKANN